MSAIHCSVCKGSKFVPLMFGASRVSVCELELDNQLLFLVVRNLLHVVGSITAEQSPLQWSC